MQRVRAKLQDTGDHTWRFDTCMPVHAVHLCSAWSWAAHVLKCCCAYPEAAASFFYIGVDGHGNSDGCMWTPSQNALNPETRAREALLEAGDSGSSIPERQNAKPFRGLKTNLEQLIN